MIKDIVKTSEIKFNVGLDTHHVPKAISWKAEENGQAGNCDAIMLSMWDKQAKNTLRIDLWTTEMTVDDMKKFIQQSMFTMADTLERATSESEHANAMREFAKHFGERSGIQP